MATRKQYTKEFKQDAVRLVTEQGYKQTEAARNLGIDRSMLARWIKEFQADQNESFRGNGRLTGEQEELRATLSPEVERWLRPGDLLCGVLRESGRLSLLRCYPPEARPLFF